MTSVTCVIVAISALIPLDIGLHYPVIVARGALASLYALVEQHAPNHRYAIISDATVDVAHGDRASAGFPAARTLRMTVPSGETFKTRTEWLRLSDALLAWGAGRDTTVIALGGGVTGDLAGFVAATLHRGVPLVQVPTTLLAMVDSSVGGKTGVDTDAGKNLIGAFHDPSLVVADVDVLRTLPSDVRADGLAEMIKHGVIADADAFSELCGLLPVLSGARGAEADALPALVAKSVAIKAHVVRQDAREAGLRQILNAGHTIAHAVEHVTSYEVSHGAAVAIGLVAEARMAELMGVGEPGLSAMIGDAVRRAGLPSSPPEHATAKALLEATRTDKKARSGVVRYALPERIGRMSPGPEGGWTTAVPDEVVLEALGGG